MSSYSFNLLALSSSVLLWLWTLPQLLYIQHASAQLASPTETNSTGKFFLGTNSYHYQNKHFSCSGTTDCYIVCTGVYACRSTTVDVLDTSTNSISILCDGSNACEYLKLNTSASGVDIDISCTETDACYYTAVGTLYTNNVAINCVGASQSCERATFRFQYASNVDMLCGNATQVCYYTHFDFSGSATVTAVFDHGAAIVSSSTGPGRYTTLDAQGVTGTFELLCVYQYDCSYLTVNAQGSNIVNAYFGNYGGYYMSQLHMEAVATANITCDTTYACYSADFYCPSGANTCTFHCLSDGNACYNMDIYIPDDSYRGLQLDCAGINGWCSSTDVHCVDTGLITTWAWDSGTASYGCGTDYQCCPYKGSIPCPGSSACEINCLNQTTCGNSEILAGSSTSLNLTCVSNGGSNACAYSDVVCPDGGLCNIYCAESYACQYMNVVAGASSTVNIYCSVSNACYYLAINTDTVSNFRLDCTALTACQYVSIVGGTSGSSSSAVINCQDRTACGAAVMDLSAFGSLTIECVNAMATSTSSSYGACYSATIVGSSANMASVNLRCGRYDCYASDMDFTDGGTVIVDCLDLNSCESAYIRAGAADSLTVGCQNSYACRYTNFYCPSDSVEVCNVFCEDYTQSCYNSYIHVPDAFTSAYLNLGCPSTSSNSACDSIYVSCAGIRGQSVISYDYSNNTYNCSSGDSFSCCPWRVGALDCQSDWCEVLCGDDYGQVSCSNRIIDAGDALELTVTCPYGYACDSTIIYCPMGADTKCTILTDSGSSNYALNDVTIIADTTDSLIIECKGDYACNNIDVYASNANAVHITCDPTKKGAYSYSTNYYGCYYSNFYVQNVSSVTLDAVRNYGLYYSYLYAQRASAVTIFCRSGSYDYACYNGYFYLPPSSIGSTDINCYGYGCYNYLDIYTQDAGSTINVDINGCGLCTSTSSCISSWDVNCPSGFDSDTYYGTYCSDGVCDCNDIETTFTDNGNADLCVGGQKTLKIGAIDTMVWVWVGVGVLGFIILLVCCCQACKRKRRRITPFTPAPVTKVKPFVATNSTASRTPFSATSGPGSAMTKGTAQPKVIPVNSVSMVQQQPSMLGGYRQVGKTPSGKIIMMANAQQSAAPGIAVNPYGNNNNQYDSNNNSNMGYVPQVPTVSFVPAPDNTDNMSVYSNATAPMYGGGGGGAAFAPAASAPGGYGIPEADGVAPDNVGSTDAGPAPGSGYADLSNQASAPGGLEVAPSAPGNDEIELPSYGDVMDAGNNNNNQYGPGGGEGGGVTMQ